MRVTRLVAPCLGLALVGCKPTLNDTYNALPALGTAIPDFHYPTLDGAVLTPPSLRGRPTVVALWAMTCSASRLALASLGNLEREYTPRGARVVILADDQDQAAVVAGLPQAGVTVPVALGGHTLMDTFTHGQSPLPWRKAFALPTFLVLNAEGRVIYRQIGIEQDTSWQLASVRARLDSLPKNAPSRVGARAG